MLFYGGKGGFILKLGIVKKVTTINIESRNLSSRPALETEPSIGFRIMMFKNIE